MSGALGRRVNHDPRSRAYAVQASGQPLVAVEHTIGIPVLDQGAVGSCVAHTGAEILSTPRYWQTAKPLTLDADFVQSLPKVRYSTVMTETTYPLDSLVAAADRTRKARDELTDAVILGRDVYGYTWRVIAQAVNMTEGGVRALYRREVSHPGQARTFRTRASNRA